MSKRFVVKGVNDDKDFCECCGRKNLKRVVWIEDTETGSVKHFGTTCAVQPVKGFDVEREVKAAIGSFEAYQKSINAAAYRKYKELGGKYIPHPTKEYTSTPADPDLYQKARAMVVEARAKFYASFKPVQLNQQ